MNARARFRTDPPGVVEVPARNHPVVVIHVGPSVYIHCRRGSWSHCGLSVHGDIDIVPAGIPARWEMKERDSVILLDVEDPRVEIRNRFQIRDRKLEVLGQAMWRESHAGNPSGRAYLEFDAVTQSAAHTGESVMVKNPGNGAYFQARVEAKGKVSVTR